MKFNFKKVASVFASVALVGATVGLAGAATFPQPFEGSSYGIVVGSSAAASDMTAAMNLGKDLANWSPTTTTSVSVGDESVKIERSADKFNIGDNASAVFITSLTKTHLPSLLADKTLRGEDNKDYKYTQKIALNESLILSHFSEWDYNNEEPVLGFNLDSSTEVLRYDLDFTTAPNATSAAGVLQYSTIEILGKPYFISETSDTSITLLDSSASTTINEGESSTLNVGGKSYNIVPEAFTSTTVRLRVNGELTNALSQGSVYDLGDGVYVGLKDYVPVEVERDLRMVEVVIGSGKIELIHGSNVKLNDKTVRELTSTFDTASNDNLNKITITWTTDDREFVTEDSKITMPVFGNVDFIMTGMNMPAGESVKLGGDGSKSIRLSAPINSGNANINLLYTGTTVEDGFTGLGKNSKNVFVTSAGSTLTFNETARDRNFVVSWASGSESQSYLLTASLTLDDTTSRATISDAISGTAFCEDVAQDGNCAVGNVVLTLSAVNATTGNKYVTMSSSAGATTFDRIYTTNGLRVMLPVVNSSAIDLGAEEIASDALACANFSQNNVLYTGVVTYNKTDTGVTNTSCNTTVTLQMTEARTTDDARGSGTSFYAVLGVDGGTSSSLKTQVSSISGVDTLRIKDTDDYVGYVASDYSTKVLHSTGGDQDYIEATYYGDEVYADVYLTSSASSTTGTGTEPTKDQVFVYTDTEAVNMDRNLIVVGGSCINTMAATLLKGNYCGADFTTQTGVGAGQYLIETFTRGNKVALLVAGYNAGDTTNAVNALMSSANNIEVAVNAKYVGSTASNPERQ